MHMYNTMKKARVSSVYEGKERNRYSSKGEETRRDHSKHARLTAKARMNVHKESMKSLSKHKKQMVMMMKSMRKNEETQEDHKNVIVRVSEKEKEEEEKDEEGSIMEKIDEKTEVPFTGWVEEWPHTLTYEEEWTWFAFAYGWGRWWRYDAVMSGENWFN